MEIEDFKKQIELEFDENNSNIGHDINDIDVRISDIQGHILTLENAINNIDNQIKQNQGMNFHSQNQQLLSKLYGAMNKSIELLSLYQRNISDLLNLKFKYRKEQDDLKLNINRLHIDAKYRKKINDEDDFSSTKLLKMLGSLNQSINNNGNSNDNGNNQNKELDNILNDINSIDDNEDYRI